MFDIREIREDFNTITGVLGKFGMYDFLDQCDSDSLNELRHQYFRYEGDHDIVISSGCTRVVFIHPDLDYVFKVQYCDLGTDYCANEVKVYEMAVEHGASDFFAWTCFVGEYGNAKVYAMERVVANPGFVSEQSYKYHFSKWAEEMRKEGREVDDEEFYEEYGDTECMIEFAISVNGEDMLKAERLIYDLNINDLHCGNWGYRGDVLVLIDYGGYCQDLRFRCYDNNIDD